MEGNFGAEKNRFDLTIMTQENGKEILNYQICGHCVGNRSWETFIQREEIY